METVLITGGTGLIGTALTKLLTARNYRVIVLTRSAKPSDAQVSYALWDTEKMEIDSVAVSQADFIVHLAGEGVADKRWTRKRKQEIRESRVNGGKLLVKALSEIPNKVKTIVSASGMGWYGPDRKLHHAFVETDPPHHDFLGDTCVAWEQSVAPVKELGKRLVILRTSIVLSSEGGAFPEFRKPMRAGIAAIIGSGKQKISWIHIDDLCRAYLAAIENDHLSGVYNASAPEVVSNKEFVLKLAKRRNRRFLAVHVPELALKIALGEVSIEVLKSTTLNNNKLRESGFQFAYPTLDAAFNALELL